ncbi:hypothetical protein M2165_000586 [Variovorax sp. TBS-050B]|uniref:hypothetical protein n=1 Tax=Variovorax sp. TBS-050B TaxID=2940551 RepID=UPI002475BE7A|nr:hypothetical protein [Variovorax sp. TBS-050B]MDH6590697.1 hypothetical protein [Variovorax sp. TBS-050B]
MRTAYRARERPCEDIAEVNVLQALSTFNLVFAFRDTRLTFMAKVGTPVLWALPP